MAPLSSIETQRWLAQYIEGSQNPDLRDYGHSLTQELKDGSATRLIWSLQYIMRLGQMRKSRVLDVGCGFGWKAAAVSMLGDNHVVANDIRATMTGPVEERVRALKAQGAPINVETITGDICQLDLPAESFDAVMSIEAIEHIHDLEQFFGVAHSLLKPGGGIVLTDDLNVFKRDEALETRRMWERREHSWTYINDLKKRRPIENANIKPYAVMREEIVRQVNPSLTSQQTRRIVDATAGLTRSEIAPLAESYQDGTPLPTPNPLSMCRNPETGEFCERLLDPYEIREMGRRVGFRTTVLHAFRRFPLNLLNAVRFRPLNLWLFNLRGSFVIFGKKP